MWLFLAFLAVPLIEIALFIQVGGAIGLWPTLLIVVLTALLGTILVRSQGTQAMNDVRGSFGQLRDPTEPLAHGAMILFSGALLLTPGFFTDAVGFALLVPNVRNWVIRRGKERFKSVHFSTGPDPFHDQRSPRRPPRDGGIIDGEYTEVDPEDLPKGQPTGRPSGWTKQSD